MTNLTARIDELVAQHTLTRAQGEDLLRAAHADHPHKRGAGAVPGRPQGGAALEVLGYIGASLLLGAAVCTGFLYWDEMSGLTQKLVALAAVLVPGVAGVLLLATRWRPHVGQVLMAAALCAIPFPWMELFGWTSALGPCLVMLIGGVAGVVLLRHWVFLAPLIAGGYGVTVDQALGFESYSAWHMVIGFALLAVIVAGAGWLVHPALSWSLAGLTGWAAASALIDTPLEAWGVLAASTVVAALLFLAFIRANTHATAVVGSLMVLSMWPWCLADLFGSSLGVAVGLMGAGTVLITVVVVISRRSHQRSVAVQTV